LFAGRDYSFFGIYVLTLIFTALSLAVFTIATDIVMSQGFAIFVVVAGMLFFWVYDLAMILRRRKPKETIAAALDLYRDTLNFIGYPVRIMRMPRGRKRIKF
jgi:FtsH-binding integral membrane protein